MKQSSQLMRGQPSEENRNYQQQINVHGDRERQIRKRFEQYDALFEKFEERFERMEMSGKNGQVAAGSEHREDGGSGLFGQLLNTLALKVKRTEDNMLDLKIMLEKQSINFDNKLRQVMSRVERSEASINTVESAIRRFERAIKEVNSKTESSLIRLSSFESLSKLVDTSKPSSDIVKLFAKFESNSTNMSAEIAELRRFVTSSVLSTSASGGCSSGDNQGSTLSNTAKRHSKATIIVRDDIDRPLPTFQDTNRKFFVGGESSTKKLGERLLQASEGYENTDHFNAEDSHMLSFNNSPNFAQQLASPTERHTFRNNYIFEGDNHSRALDFNRVSNEKPPTTVFDIDNSRLLSQKCHASTLQAQTNQNNNIPTNSSRRALSSYLENISGSSQVVAQKKCQANSTSQVATKKPRSSSLHEMNIPATQLTSSFNSQLPPPPPSQSTKQTAVKFEYYFSDKPQDKVESKNSNSRRSITNSNSNLSASLREDERREHKQDERKSSLRPPINFFLSKNVTAGQQAPLESSLNCRSSSGMNSSSELKKHKDNKADSERVKSEKRDKHSGPLSPQFHDASSQNIGTSNKILNESQRKSSLLKQPVEGPCLKAKDMMAKLSQERKDSYERVISREPRRSSSLAH